MLEIKKKMKIGVFRAGDIVGEETEIYLDVFFESDYTLLQLYLIAE